MFLVEGFQHYEGLYKSKGTLLHIAVATACFCHRRRLVTINKKENPQKMKHNSFFITSAM